MNEKMTTKEILVTVLSSPLWLPFLLWMAPGFIIGHNLVPWLWQRRRKKVIFGGLGSRQFDCDKDCQRIQVRIGYFQLIILAVAFVGWFYW